jgi:transcriptional regulator with XRE-family HTH domain
MNHYVSPGDLKKSSGFSWFLGVEYMETIGSRIRMVRKLNKINQVDFSNRVRISQATLSELEQDKYKPSVDTIISICSEFNSDIRWILLGSEGFQGEAFKVNGINQQEAQLLLIFEKLKEKDREEIIEIIKMKIKRY